MLEKVDPKRELLDKLKDARKLNPSKLKQEIYYGKYQLKVTVFMKMFFF